MELFRSAPIKLSDRLFMNPEVISSEVQLLRVGKFFQKDVEIEVTRETLKSIVNNFSEGVRKIDLMIDFAHDSDKEAAAWIQTLHLSENGTELWAVVDWTDDGDKAVRKKKYRYLSADFQFNYKDNETLAEYGPTLFGAGLTNRPVVKGMQPTIELSETKLGDNSMSLEEMKKELEEMKGKLAERDATIKEMKGKADTDKKLAEEKEAEVKLAEEKAVADKKLADEKSAEEKVLSEKKTDFDKMLSEGKTVEAQRDAFMKDDMKEYIAKASDIKLNEQGTGANGNNSAFENTETPAQDEVIELSEKKAKEENLDIGTAQSLVLSENKELKEKYEKEISE